MLINTISKQVIESDWRSGKFKLSRIQCRSQNSKGVYCLQVEIFDVKIEIHRFVL